MQNLVGNDWETQSDTYYGCGLYKAYNSIIYNWYIAAEQLNQNEINITMVGNFMIK